MMYLCVSQQAVGSLYVTAYYVPSVFDHLRGGTSNNHQSVVVVVSPLICADRSQLIAFHLPPETWLFSPDVYLT